MHNRRVQETPIADIPSSHSTGKRSKEGALQDGVNSVIRYIKNNYLDGPRQDAYDLVTGAWIPRKGEEQSWKDARPAIVRVVRLAGSARARLKTPHADLTAPRRRPSSCCLLSSRCSLSALLRALSAVSLGCFRRDFQLDLTRVSLAPSEYLISSRQFTLLAVVVFGVSTHYILTRGSDYVSKPKLVLLDDVFNYSGKGYESGRRGRPFPAVVKMVSVEGAVKSRQMQRKDSNVLPTSGVGAKQD